MNLIFIEKSLIFKLNSSIDVLDIILKDVKDFDPQIWVYAVTISVSALIALAFTVCVLLLRDHYLDLEERRARGKRLFSHFNKLHQVFSNA